MRPSAAVSSKRRTNWCSRIASTPADRRGRLGLGDAEGQRITIKARVDEDTLAMNIKPATN